MSKASEFLKDLGVNEAKPTHEELQKKLESLQNEIRKALDADDMKKVMKLKTESDKIFKQMFTIKKMGE
jgi:uncharacterized membrane protein (DUF106 family)